MKWTISLPYEFVYNNLKTIPSQTMPFLLIFFPRFSFCVELNYIINASLSQKQTLKLKENNLISESAYKRQNDSYMLFIWDSSKVILFFGGIFCLLIYPLITDMCYWILTYIQKLVITSSHFTQFNIVF